MQCIYANASAHLQPSEWNDGGADATGLTLELASVSMHWLKEQYPSDGHINTCCIIRLSTADSRSKKK